MSPRASLRYTVDDANRLLTVDARNALAPPRVLEGRFSLASGNRLVYHVTRPSGQPIPSTVSLDGTWSLTPAHDLALALRAADHRARQTLHLKGALVKAETHALVFALRRRQDEDLRSAQRVSFSGRWQADAHNRLTFLAEKGAGDPDRLVLQGGWEVGRDHELRYRYQQRLGLRPDEEHTLIFDGRWDITTRDRLVYRLTGSPRSEGRGSSDSAFEFRASLQSPSLLASRRRIVYQLGIGATGGRTRQWRVTLLGTWKLHRDLSVAFEVPYAGGRMEAIRFFGELALSRRDRLAVALRTPRQQPVGLTVVFTRRVRDDTHFFVRMKADRDEAAAIGGVRVQF